MASLVEKISNTSFNVTRQRTLPNGSDITQTLTLTLSQARRMKAQYQSEVDKLQRMLDSFQSRIDGLDGEMQEAIAQGVQEENA